MPHKKPSTSKLETYRKKRSAGGTPEPFGGDGIERPGLFVVQQHDASRMHYDLRLEIGGVMKSWAVPKGPSLDTADKRLAVLTEDHPMEYGDFEGVIPKGNYGAGAMIVWDRGLSVHHLDPEEGVETGKLLFELKGYKLRGMWTLVKTTRSENEWLLIKKPDSAATGETVEELPPESVFSGLTVQELGEGADRAGEIRDELEELGATRRQVDPAKAKIMLAQLRDEPFSREGWLFELKYDGYRVLAATDRSAGTLSREIVTLRYRSGLDSTDVYPDLVRAMASLPYRSLVLDGEVVVLDDEARPSFQRLQKRARLTRWRDIERAAVRLPAVYFVFDLLGFEDYDLRRLPLVERKRILRRVLPQAGPIRFADHVEERGEALYDQVNKAGLEGLVAKRADALYRGGRSSNWQKIRAARSGDFAIVGFTEAKGSRVGFGALHLGYLSGSKMLYAGRVGTGFDDALLEELHARLAPAKRPEPPLSGPAPKGKEHAWVEPRLVAEVKYTEWTEAGQLRHPVFLHLRDDKKVAECVRDDLPPEPEEGAVIESRGPVPEVQITRPHKVFWPEEGYTKGDLVEYYRAIAPWLLPYLKDRPVVLTRYPDGIEGKSFFQKNIPDHTPRWIRTESIWSEDSGKETRYFICDTAETLLYLANLGTIPLHLWSSRMPALQAPDWSILDLDAKDAPFSAAVKVARTIGKLCDEIELDCFVKTSGASGLHVLIPLGGACTYQQSKQIAELIARLVSQELRDIASIARMPRSREGKIYIDTVQNGYGKLLVSPFCVRSRPGAPVSMPLRWTELNSKLSPARFHIKNAPARLKRLGEDPLAGVLELKPDLTGALARLAERF
jgi:bifunctional non-homologous end joining protein LigD